MKTSVAFLTQFILQEKLLFLFGLLLTFVGSGFMWLGPKIIASLIDNGFLKHDVELSTKLVAALAVTEVLRQLTVFFSQLTYAKLGQNVIQRVRTGMVEHLLKLPVPYFDSVSSGRMMTKIVNDVNSLTDFFQSGFVSVLGNLASIIAIFFGLFMLNFRLGLELFCVFIPMVVACSFFSTRLRIVYEDARNRLSELNSKLADFLFGMRTVRALGLGKRKYEELNHNVQEYASAQMNMVGTLALFHPTLSLGIGVMLLVLIGHGAPMMSSGDLKVGEWIAALSYVIVLQQPLMEISDRWNFFLAGVTSVDRIREVFAEQIEQSGSELAAKFRSIAFDHVSFRYPEAKTNSLDEVSTTIQRGDWVGVYGESGSGKSTFLQMLYGFYRPTEGALLWNGTSYDQFSISSLRSNFGVVEQFPFLFHGTVKENITLFGRYEFSEGLLLSEFLGFKLIESLFQLLDFEISERGENLSMGQKQMITFLRAYLARPEIWILDEATAFFDQEAEQEVLKALQNLTSKGITVIQVAHRPEALVQMKRMFKVANGRIAEVRSNCPL